MAVNRYNLPANFEYMPLPYEELMRSGAIMQDQEDKAKQGLIDLGNKQYKSLSKDQEKLYAAQQSVNQNIDDVYERYKDKGLRQAANDIHKLRRDIAQREGQFGDIGAMQSNLAAHNAYVKNLDDMYQKKDISKNKRDQLINMSMNEYKGIGEPDMVGRYNPYNGITAAQDVDMAKQADDLAKGWKETKIGNEGWKESGDGTLYKKVGNKTEYISEKEIYNNILPQLMNDPRNKAYAQQEVAMRTYGQEIDPNVKSQLYNKMFEDPTTYVANKYGYKSSERTEDIQFTPEHLLDRKEAGGTYDDIAASTWKFNPLGKDITDAGQGTWTKLLGLSGDAPRYEAMVGKMDEAKQSLEALKSQMRPNVTDTQLNSQILSKQVEYNNLQRVNSALEKMYNAEQEKSKGKSLNLKPYIDPTWSQQLKDEVQMKWDNSAKKTSATSKEKFFEENFSKVANEVVQYQKSEDIGSNGYLNNEVRTALTTQGSKQVFATNGEQMKPEIVIPTGYVTDIFGKGMVNQSYAYFTSKDEAKKSGYDIGDQIGQINEVTGEQVKADMQQALKAGSQKNNTIAGVTFPDKDATYYRVPVYSETRKDTKAYMNDKKANPAITSELSRWQSSTMNRGPIYDFSDKVQIHTVQKPTGSLYTVKVGDRELSVADPYTAIQAAIELNAVK